VGRKLSSFVEWSRRDDSRWGDKDPGGPPAKKSVRERMQGGKRRKFRDVKKTRGGDVELVDCALMKRDGGCVLSDGMGRTLCSGGV
jgi:hypothetical protein